MPFQSWRMRPKSTNHLFFTLNTQSFEITFEIRVSFAAFYLCTQDKSFFFSSKPKENENTRADIEGKKKIKIFVE
jgi:hypothetical protein